MVKDLYGLTKEEFLSKIEEYFEIKGPYEEASVPKKKGTMGMYLKDSWYELNLKDTYRIDDEVEGLDVSILQKDILGPVLGILDPRTDDRIRFVGGIRGEKELEIMVQNGYAAAFLMHPTSMDELFAIADAGKLMPPKSTWFEPKLRSGLLLHKIEAV